MSTEPIWLRSISLLWTDTILYANLSVNTCEFPDICWFGKRFKALRGSIDYKIVLKF